MKALTEAEVRQWFGESHETIGIKADAEYGEPYYDNPDANILILPYPSTPLQASYYSRLTTSVGLGDNQPFEGAIFWLTRWNLGPTSPVGWKLLERVRAGCGETRPLEIAPAQSFRRDEQDDLGIFALAAFTFGWSAFIIPFSSNEHFVYIDHKDRWCIVTRTAEEYGAVQRDISSLKIEPCNKDVFNWRERFCRKPS